VFHKNLSGEKIITGQEGKSRLDAERLSNTLLRVSRRRCFPVERKGDGKESFNLSLREED